MSIRKRPLKPDQKGRYRPYLGYRQDGKQPRFNLGTNRAEAEKRLNRLYELWEENVSVGGEEVWTPVALGFAERIASGAREIKYHVWDLVSDAVRNGGNFDFSDRRWMMSAETGKIV